MSGLRPGHPSPPARTDAGLPGAEGDDHRAGVGEAMSEHEHIVELWFTYKDPEPVVVLHVPSGVRIGRILSWQGEMYLFRRTKEDGTFVFRRSSVVEVKDEWVRR